MAGAALWAGIAHGGTWAHAPWTNDADSGIVAGGTYTMAVNANGGATTVNGIAFEAWNNGTGTNYSTDSGGGAYANDNNNNIAGDGAAMSTTFIYGINPRTLTLTNLEEGATYQVSFFSTGWEASGRAQTFASGSDSVVIDQDSYGDNNGIRVHYTFVADSNTRVITISEVSGGTFHLCAMANRQVTPAPWMANIKSFGVPPDMPGAIDEGLNTIALYVPTGTNVTNLGPQFTLSAGATCYDANPSLPAAKVVSSGQTFDFTNPVHYWVRSFDTLTVQDYTVTVVTYTPGSSYIWAATAAGTYDWKSVNWNNPGWPNGVGHAADFHIDIAGAQTINLNGTITLGSLALGDAASGYVGNTIAPGTGGSLVMDATTGDATITRTGGNGVADTISANIQLNDNLVVSDANGSDSDGGNFSLKLTGPITEGGGSRSVTKTAGGAVTLSGTNSYTGGTTVGQGGFFRFNPASIGSGPLTINGDNGNPPDITSNGQPLNGNEVIINGGFRSHYGFQTGNGPVRLAAAGIQVQASVNIQGVVTALDGSNSLNALDIDLGGVGGWGANQRISSNIVMRGNQTMTHNSGWGTNDMWRGIVSGIISDGGNGYSLTKAGNSHTELAGANTYTGDTIVSAGKLTLGSTGSTKFKVTDSGSNKITGTAEVVLNGPFNIDTSAVTVSAGAWTLIDVDLLNETFGASFNVPGFTQNGTQWTKSEGGRFWIFDQTTGVLSLPKAWILSFSWGGNAGIIDQDALTINLTVPNGVSLATLNPTFTLASGTCNQTSGSAPSPTFAAQNPATYTVTDGAVVRAYTVKVTVGPPPPYGIGNGLVLWLDASATDTMTLSDTTTVTEWRDKMGGTIKATTKGGTPTLVSDGSGPGGKPTVRFNTAAWMNDGVNHSTPVTIFYVGRYTGGSNARVLSAGNNWLMGFHGGQYNRFYFEGWVNETGVGADTAPHLFAATIPGSGQNSTVYEKGVLVASNNGGTTGPNSLQLNGYNNSTNETSDCDISEVLVYNRVLSDSALNAVGYYLAQKYGLTTSYVPVEPARIMEFSYNGQAAVINQDWLSIDLGPLPKGTVLANVAPVFGLSSGTCNQPSGLPPTPNFGSQNPATYTVTDGATVNEYTVTVTVTPPSSEKYMANVRFPEPSFGYSHATYAHATNPEGTDFVIHVPSGTPVGLLSPTYDLAAFASGNPVSGTQLDFGSPQSYTVTAEDLSSVAVPVAVAPYAGYAARVAASNPVGYWPMNEGRENRAIDNIGGFHGTYSDPGVTRLTEGPEGPTGQPSVTFSGTGNVGLRVPNTVEMHPDTSFSVELWAKPASVPPASNPQYVASNVRMAGDREGWYLAQDNGSVFLTGVNSFVIRLFKRTGSTRACQLWTPVDSVRWYHLVLTYDSNTKVARLYTDGETNDVDQKGVATVDAYFGSTHPDPMTVGVRSDSNFAWGGSAAHLAFYNRALTAAEVKTHFTGGAADPYDTWIAGYPGLTGDNALRGADPDGDGRSNQYEFAFGLDPTKGTSVVPIIVPLAKGTGKFTYTRYAESGLGYTVWTSTDLATWAGPAAFTESVTGPDAKGVETVEVTLTSPPAGGSVFVRVKAE